MGRGDVRSAILSLLAERPMHGYQIIQQIEERSGAPGSRARARSTRPCSCSPTRASSRSKRPMGARRTR
jgi:hypothetical protein